MKSIRPSTHFSPLQFSFTDSRGRNIGNIEPPPTATAAAYTTTSSKMTNKTANNSNDESTEQRTGSIPRKRKYGHSVAERKQRRRSARKQTVANVDPTGGDDDRVDGQDTTMNIDADTNDNGGDYPSSQSMVEKENVSPDLKEFDFTSGSCDSIVSDNNDAATAAADAANDYSLAAAASDNDSDDDSPIQRRLFVNKKRVLEDSDEEESDEEEIVTRGRKSVTVVTKKIMSVEEEEESSCLETTKVTLALTRASSRGKKKSNEEEGKKKTSGKATVSKSKSNRAPPRRKDQSSMESDDSESFNDDSFDLCAKVASSRGGSKKKVVAASKTKLLSATTTSKNKMDIDEDNDFTEKTNQPNPNAPKAKTERTKEITPASSSRQLARIIADKSAKAKSPYVQEMCARAQAALKNDKKKQQDALSDNNDDDDDDSLERAKAIRTRRKSTIRSTTRTAGKKAKRTTIDESDDESEYQPTQEAKKTTRSANTKKPHRDLGLDYSNNKRAASSRAKKAAVMLKNQDDVGDKEQVDTKMSTMRVTRSRRQTANAADSATEKKNGISIKRGRDSRSGPVASVPGSSVNDREGDDQGKKSTIAHSSSNASDEVKVEVENQANERLWETANAFDNAFDDDALVQPASREDDSVKNEKSNQAISSEDCRSNPHVGKNESNVSFIELNTRSISAFDQRKMIVDILKQTDDSDEPSATSKSSTCKTQLENVQIMACRLVEAQQLLVHAQEIVVNVKHQLEEMTKALSKDV
eukprot:scaffold45662_cov73-Cyclotella_meneghiniana.AAC.2